ncbi:hypothetical protein GE09DRAFT_557419 [Coniochaeta sp. 2T2.1]|nr:hypothetical protein GE09DRAFT_557419 [Coniochaeta sp. 2T2.1]
MPSYIYIHGYPGVGARTVAKELEQLIAHKNGPRGPLLPVKFAPLYRHRDPAPDRTQQPPPPPLDVEFADFSAGILRRHALASIDAAEPDRETTLIFADLRCATPAEFAIAQRGVPDYLDAAAKRAVPFVVVILICSRGAEHQKRLEDRDRYLDGVGKRKKLRNWYGLVDIMERVEMFRLHDGREMVLDTSRMAPVEAARMIFNHVVRVETHCGFNQLSGRVQDLSLEQ